MKYKTVPIKTIKPDKNQPRKKFDDDALKAMAVSIKSEGIINAIEVDPDLMIITGEQRWRAASIAGLKEVPIKIIEKISPQQRFIRQMQENVHQNTMSPLETAEGYEKIRQWLLSSAAEVKEGRGGYRVGVKGVKELHELFGKAESSISDYLSLLGEVGEMKEALSKKGFQITKLTALQHAPEKYHAKLKHIIATQTEMPRDVVRHIIKGLNRAEKYGETDKAEKLLKQDFGNLTIVQAANKINKIIPDEESRVKEPADAVKFVSEKIVELMELLEKHPLRSFDKFHGPLLVKDLQTLGFFLKTYMQGKEVGSEKRLLLEVKK